MRDSGIVEAPQDPVQFGCKTRQEFPTVALALQERAGFIEFFMLALSLLNGCRTSLHDRSTV